jgi:hypothetical protein
MKTNRCSQKKRAATYRGSQDNPHFISNYIYINEPKIIGNLIEWKRLNIVLTESFIFILNLFFFCAELFGCV